ncbi:uncharacterized protein LOC120201566 [Hibiscus syriacus]|uniref:uncharacterized protein LOC120201566 n=1 Tax=Hibiscus syriacus TaxID=106335 RepID=UPI0019244C8C|nr:uncharacterized protein LOC120201566 [Hibiscus syriacus]
MSGDHDSSSVSNTDRPTILSHSSSTGDDDPATPTPQTLAAEQPTEANTASHVFARTTAATREWSMRSNESLFSLHMGNPSFTTEQLNWMSKSGEFYFYNDSPLCSPLPPGTPWNNLSSAEFAIQRGVIGLNSESLFSIHKGNMSFIGSLFQVTPRNNQTATETTGQSRDSNGGCIRDTEAEATDTTREKASQVRKVDVHKELSFPSFSGAKPCANIEEIKDIRSLIGDTSENGSPPQSTEKQSQQECSTPRTPETLSETANEAQTTPETPKLGCPKENTESPSGTPKPQTPKTTRNGGPKKWLACFSCCTASPASATS